MHVEIGNIFSKITECSSKELDFINGILQVSVPNHQYMPSFRNGQWDGKKSFFSVAYKTFLTGFLPFILREAEKKKIIFIVKDTRKFIPTGDPSTLHHRYQILRPYQVDTLNSILTSHLRFSNQVVPFVRGVMKSHTGSGKTLMTACMVDFLHKKTLYIVDRRNLAHQTLKEFQKVTKMSVGILGDGLDNVSDITIAMIQTLKNRYKDRKFQKYLESIDLIVIDECHKISKGMYHKVLVKCPAYFRVGLSGTPLIRGDMGDLFLIADTGEVLSESNRQELEEAGHLAKPKVYIFPVTQPSGIGHSFKRAYSELIVYNDIRNGMIIEAVKKLLKKDCNILILVSLLDHGNILKQMLKKAKIPSVYVHGKATSEERKVALDSIGIKRKVIIASRIFDEGMDKSNLNALVMAGAGASSTKTIQRVGRVARPKPGENVCYVVDFVDRNNAYLLKHSATRISTYESEGFKVHFPKQV